MLPIIFWTVVFFFFSLFFSRFAWFSVWIPSVCRCSENRASMRRLRNSTRWKRFWARKFNNHACSRQSKSFGSENVPPHSRGFISCPVGYTRLAEFSMKHKRWWMFLALQFNFKFIEYNALIYPIEIFWATVIDTSTYISMLFLLFIHFLSPV